MKEKIDPGKQTGFWDSPEEPKVEEPKVEEPKVERIITKEQLEKIVKEREEEPEEEKEPYWNH